MLWCTRIRFFPLTSHTCQSFVGNQSLILHDTLFKFIQQSKHIDMMIISYNNSKKWWWCCYSCIYRWLDMLDKFGVVTKEKSEYVLLLYSMYAQLLFVKIDIWLWNFYFPLNCKTQQDLHYTQCSVPVFALTSLTSVTVRAFHVIHNNSLDDFRRKREACTIFFADMITITNELLLLLCLHPEKIGREMEQQILYYKNF